MRPQVAPREGVPLRETGEWQQALASLADALARPTLTLDG